MLLKKIDIQGFKSFADKVTIEVNDGITAVIGPNGSGKSNISDAVRWVLGEQSMKNLRGSKSEDVIFAGTENRKPVGFAEVSLTIDNSKRLLPVDYSEVTVTRRVYRSGESDFLINKNQCRLKDINELFMGTGVGKDGYSIIGQGRIDEILSSKSEDRRLIFEEASGIMKYKVRKIETERKLEQTKQNLLRINDIIGELEKQIEPLREQSETAKKFLALKERLKVLEVNLFIDNMSKFKEKLEEVQAQMDIISSQIQNEQTVLEQNQDKKKMFQADFERLEAEIDSLQQLIFATGSSIEQNNSEIKLANERTENNIANFDRLGLEIDEYNKRMEELKNEFANRDKRREQLKKDKQTFELQLTEKENELLKVSSSIDSEQEKVESLKADIIDKMNHISERKTELNSLKILLEGMEKREVQIGQELEQLILDSDLENMRKDDISENIKNFKSEIDRENSERLQYEERKTEIAKSLKIKSEKLDSIRLELSNKQSRCKFLNDLETEHEGYSRSVKGILEECDRNSSFKKGMHGALAQLLSVSKEYETAVEITLGAALQNIVTDDEESAKKAINFLKQRNLGRATFLPISAVNGKELDANQENLNKCKGYIGVASKLVEFDKKYQGIVNNLLGRTVVVDNIDNAVNIAKQYKYSFRIVTLDGDLVNTSGAMSGGSTASKNGGILSRGREIKELNDKVAELKKILDNELNQYEELKKEAENIDALTAEINKKINELKMSIAREEERYAGIEINIKRIDEKKISLNDEKEQIKIQKVEFDNSSIEKQQSIAKLEAEIAELQANVQKLQEKYKQSYLEKDKVSEQITDLKISLSSIDESLLSIDEVIERINSELVTCEKNINRRAEERERILNEKSKLEELIKTHELRISDFKQANKRNEEKLVGLKAAREEISKNLSDIESAVMECIKNIELSKAEYNRLELKKSRIEIDMETFQNKMWEDYEITLSIAMEYKKEIDNIPAAQREINQLKNQIKNLGPVNVAAIEEYVKTKERYEFVQSQRNDLESSEEKLRRVISEMTSIMKRQFIEQFNLINKNFDQVFKELFEGGRATLKLADEEDVLESGIDIEVQPPGKKLQSMMLLSGGEKALTAIALLFAILKINPSPFCILDEIEAALDDVNVYRFNDYIRKLENNIQFIIITHRKGTMESADSLYGVTMEERGISKLVSLKMTERAS